MPVTFLVVTFAVCVTFHIISEVLIARSKSADAVDAAAKLVFDNAILAADVAFKLNAKWEVEFFAREAVLSQARSDAQCARILAA